MIYLDSNALIAGVVNVPQRTAPLQRFFRQARGPIWASPLCDYEARKGLWQLPEVDWRTELNTLLQGRVTLVEGGWDMAISQALELARQFKARLAVDSADTLHVGWALAMNAKVFASFDRSRGPRALALCLGLKVWPDPQPADYEAMRRLKA